MSPTKVRGSDVRPLGVTWKVTLYCGGRVWVGPGVPILTNLVVSGTTVVVGTTVVTIVVGAVGVTGGVGAGWVQPAAKRRAATRKSRTYHGVFFMLERSLSSRYNPFHWNFHRSALQDLWRIPMRDGEKIFIKIAGNTSLFNQSWYLVVK
jgi:hypothetical protein